MTEREGDAGVCVLRCLRTLPADVGVIPAIANIESLEVLHSAFAANVYARKISSVILNGIKKAHTGVGVGDGAFCRWIDLPPQDICNNVSIFLPREPCFDDCRS